MNNKPRFTHRGQLEMMAAAVKKVHKRCVIASSIMGGQYEVYKNENCFIGENISTGKHKSEYLAWKSAYENVIKLNNTKPADNGK